MVGLGMQTASDIAAGGRRSSFGDNAGAAFGGAAGAATLPFGPGRAGAVGGWATSAAQNVFNGRPISLDPASETAIASNVLAPPPPGIGTRTTNPLASTPLSR